MKDSNRLIDIMLDDVKPEKIHLTFLKGDCMYPTIMIGDTITLDYNVDKSTLKDKDIILYRNSTKYIYLHRYHKNYGKISSDNSIFFDPHDFTLIARIAHIKKDKFHFFRKLKYNILHFVNSSIQFIEWSTREQMIDSSKVILPESLDINNLKKIAEHNNIKSYIQERLNSLNIRITDEKAITSDIIRSELFKQAYKYFGNLLKTNDIPYIPFKGIDFAQRYYDCFHDRAMADIDLMVQKRDLGKIVDIISKNNCPISIISHLEIDSKLHHHIQIRLDKFNGLLVELHWKYCFLNYKCDLNHDLSRKLVIQNDKNFLFSNEANLCFASIHFLAGTENILRILIDVLLILQKSEINYRKLEQTATYLNCKKRVGKVLTFVSFLRKNFQHDYQPTYSKTTLRPKIRNAFLKHVISKTKKLSIIEKILLRTLTTETLTDFLKYSMNRIIFRLK